MLVIELKYEAVYLHELADGFAAQRVIAEWMEFYNEVRPHSALDGRTPAEAYWRGGARRAGGVARWGGVQTASTGNGASGCAPRSGSCPHIHRDSYPRPDPTPGLPPPDLQREGRLTTDGYTLTYLGLSNQPDHLKGGQYRQEEAIISISVLIPLALIKIRL